MAKLTKAQKQAIQIAINAIDRLNRLIESPTIEFCRVSTINAKIAQGPLDYRARAPHETKHYVGKDNYEWDIDFIKELTPMDKGIGSDLVARYDAKKALERLLAE